VVAIDRAAELLGWAGNNGVDVVANVLLLLAALGCAVFAVMYTRMAAWRTTAIGRHMFYFAWAVLFAYVVAVCRSVWPDQDWLDYVRVVALAVVAFVFWQRVYLLVSVRRKAKREGTDGLG